MLKSIKFTRDELERFWGNFDWELYMEIRKARDAKG